MDLEPRVGSKPGKTRPCLAVQPTAFGEAGLTSTVILPITSKLIRGNNYPLRIRLPKGTPGLKRESEILIDQLLAWDHRLFKEELGELSPHLQEKVKEALVDFLDL